MAGPRAFTFARAVVLTASRLVPADVRREWVREWLAELEWASSRRGGSRARLRARSLGAVVHAVWLRWDRWRLEMLVQDVTHALRTLVRQPGYCAVALLTLTLGIGANAVIFGVVRAVLLRPLPFPQAEHLVQISSTTRARPDVPHGAASPSDFVDWRNESTSFAAMAALAAGSTAWSGGGPAEQLPSAAVSGRFFAVLGVPALHGRVLTTEDDVSGAPDVVVISHRIWTRRLGANPAAVGQTITLDGRPRRLVGIMPPGFEYPLGSDVWLPLVFTADDLATQRGAHYLDVIARRRPDVTLDAARADVSAIVSRLSEAHPRTNANKAVAVWPLRDAMVGDVREALVMLLGAVALVLLMVCVNVASLTLTRAVSRQRELAVRAALGAGRVRLMNGLFAESLVLAVAGGALGLLLAVWASAAVTALDGGVGVPLLDRTQVDGPVVAFTALIALVAAAVFGALPAWRASAARDVFQRLREDAVTVTSAGRSQRMRRGLIVVETALAVVLLVGAGLLARSFSRLMSVELGFDGATVQTFTVSLPEEKYATPVARAAFVEALLDRLRADPTVKSAGAVFGLPLTNFRYSITTSTLDGRPLSDAEQDERSLLVRVVTPDYFRTMGIPVARGRAFGGGDRLGAPAVAVVNEAAAALLWPGREALGRSFALGTRLGQDGERAGGTVVGVVRNVRDFGPAGPLRPTAYLAHGQFPVDFFSVVIDAPGAVGTMVESARSALSALDPNLPMFRVRSMQQLSAAALAQPRLYLWLLGAFAAMALALAAVGIYGVLAHAVNQQTREIGIRIALGAPRGQVVARVVGQATGLALLGVALGLPVAAAARGAIAAQLFGVEAVDPATYAAVGAGLLLVAFMAALVPARRASRIDPVTALRQL